MNIDCILLDVFTDKPFTGNQLAVFYKADNLSSQQMQKLANEINYSETTFILQSTNKDADCDIRIFTPKSEVPFAGHPTLGTAYVLMEILANKERIRLNTKVGIIPLEKKGGDIWMKQNSPEFFATFTDKEMIADMVGLNADDIADDLPIEEVSTGNTILLIPIKNLSAIKRARGNMNKITEFFNNTQSIVPYLFTLETEDPKAKVHTRLFAPQYGIIEDAATGSAAGPLTAYLLKSMYLAIASRSLMNME